MRVVVYCFFASLSLHVKGYAPKPPPYVGSARKGNACLELMRLLHVAIPSPATYNYLMYHCKMQMKLSQGAFTCSQYYTTVLFGDSGSCYRPMFLPATRAEAQASCLEQGGHLANPETSDEAFALTSFAISSLSFPENLQFPSTQETRIICEGLTDTLTCANGQTISILSANYGRTAPQSPDLCDDPRDSDTNCVEPTSLGIVQGLCDGQTSCTLTPTNGVFGDPCRNTYKYLELEYQCSGGVIEIDNTGYWICPTDEGNEGTFTCEASTNPTSAMTFFGAGQDGDEAENCVTLAQTEVFNPADVNCAEKRFFICEIPPCKKVMLKFRSPRVQFAE